MRLKSRITELSCAVAAALMMACAPERLVEVEPPSTLVDPSVATTAAGAVQLYNFAISNFSAKIGGYNNTCGFVFVTALASDEAMIGQEYPWWRGGNEDVWDARDWNTGADISPYRMSSFCYQYFHQPRVQSRQAREALRLYAPDAPPAWQGQLYAIEGFSVLMLAEFFCSGIPMTVVHLDGSAAPTAGFTTALMLEHAVA